MRQFIELRIAVATEHFVNRMNIVFQNQVATKFKSRVFGPLIFKVVFVVVIEHQGRTLINLCFLYFQVLWAVRAFKTLRFVLQCVGRLRSSPGTGVGSPIPPRVGIAPTIIIENFRKESVLR